MRCEAGPGKKRKKITGFLVTIIVAAVTINSAHADEAPGSVIGIGLDSVIEASLKNMEDIKISLLESERLFHGHREARTLGYPDLTARLEWINNIRYPVNKRYPPEKMSDYEAGMGATLRQLIWSSGRVSSTVEAARKNLEIAMLKEEVTREDVIYTAKVTYYAVILAQRSLEISMGSYRNSLENKKIIEERSATGRVSRKDNIKVDADIAARLPVVRGFESDVAVATNTLKRITGIPLCRKVRVTEEFSESYDMKEPDGMVELLLEKQPVFKILEKNVSLRDSMIEIERSGYLPSVSAFFSWDYRGKSDQAKDWYIGKERLMDQFGVIGLQVEVPVFDMGRTRERIKQVQAEKNIAIMELEKTHRDLVLQLKNAVSEYNKNIEILKANTRSVELSEETFNLYQDLLRTGQVTLLEINDAELVLTSEKLQKARTLYNLNKILAGIERLIARGAGG